MSDKKNFYYALREYVSRLVSTVTELTEVLKTSSASDDKTADKKKGDNLELEGSVSAMSDFIKLTFCAEILDCRYGEHIFPTNSYGCQFSCILLESLHAVDGIATMDAQSKCLGRRVNISRTEPFVSTYLERSSGRVYDAIFNMLLNSFFSALPPTNPLFTSSDADASAKMYKARQVLETGELLVCPMTTYRPEPRLLALLYESHAQAHSHVMCSVTTATLIYLLYQIRPQLFFR